MDKDNKDDTLLSARRVMDRYGIVHRTLRRWEKEDKYAHLGFPKPIVLNRRRYWYRQALEDWEKKRAAAVA